MSQERLQIPLTHPCNPPHRGRGVSERVRRQAHPNKDIRRGLPVEVPSTIMVCELVASGIGVSIVHPFVAAGFRDNIVVRHFAPSIRFEYGLLFPVSQRRSLLTQTFVETIRADIAEHYPAA